MNLEEYNLDSLRKLVRNLEKENTELKKKLTEAGILFDPVDAFEDKETIPEAYDPDQVNRILPIDVSEYTANRFFRMFWGRTDVYAKRSVNGGYYPQCKNAFGKLCEKTKDKKADCSKCAYQKWMHLSKELIMDHLMGHQYNRPFAIGVYPLFPDGTCRFLAFDFDNHDLSSAGDDYANMDDEWLYEVSALRKICKDNGIDALTERSRSGKGAHVWIFFKQAIPAGVARQFGFLLLEKGAQSINLKNFRYYDRMFPNQDFSKGLGNLIALPLQGEALFKGNSAFVDENWNAYEKQMDKLLSMKSYTLDEINGFIEKWCTQLAKTDGIWLSQTVQGRPKPWRREDRFLKEDVVGKLHMVLADGIYIDTLNIKPRLLNQIRSLATIDNPEYFKNLHMGYYVGNSYSMISMGKDVDGYLRIPRGLYDSLVKLCADAGIVVDVSDEREKGRLIRVSFKGKLREEQDLAAGVILNEDNGILSASVAFGKTVVSSYLISKRKVNTLILVEQKELLSQWVDKLNEYLDIKEELPKYKTKTGRVKTRDSVIGTLASGNDKLNGIIDVAMIGSLYKGGDFHELINSYGMVIMDECHHAASARAQEILKKINARYVYGVSATPFRSDHLEKINYMLLGPVRHSYTPKQYAERQGIDHLVYPRFTRSVELDNPKEDITKSYEFIAKSEGRNAQIAGDVIKCVVDGRSPIVLCREKEHCRLLYELLRDKADHVFLVYGDNKDRENKELLNQLKAVSDTQSIILIATGSKIGEGFDCPRLDTLMLAAPVSYEGRLTQFVGRIIRDHKGKTSAIVYDYVDSHIHKFDQMYRKRLKTYKKIGFMVSSEHVVEKQEMQAIFDGDTYMDVFERDIIEAEKEIVISSPDITEDKINRFLFLIKPVQERGVKVTVITGEPEQTLFGDAMFLRTLIDKMKTAGINVVVKDDIEQRFAVFDRSLFWHGGMNLLGRKDAYDNLIRIKDAEIAERLLELEVIENE